MPRRIIFAMLLLAGTLAACSSPKAPDSLFIDDIQRMVMVDREMGFEENVAEIRIVSRTMHDKILEVEVRVIGSATHPDISIGATLPAGDEPRDSWATWKYFSERKGKVWKINNKFKVDEGFY